MLNESLLHTLAEELAGAERDRKPVKPISERFPELGEEDAYGIQKINATRAIAQGRFLTGYKVGLTSRSAQKHFNVFEPDFGHLFADMAWRDEAAEDLSTLIQPRIGFSRASRRRSLSCSGEI
jgi:2-keto-4-pentenoate hydratase